jgi:hypothetical protein
LGKYWAEDQRLASRLWLTFAVFVIKPMSSAACGPRHVMCNIDHAVAIPQYALRVISVRGRRQHWVNLFGAPTVDPVIVNGRKTGAEIMASPARGASGTS